MTLVDVPLPDGGTLQMPEAQLHTLGVLGSLHPGSTWHLADCGCCACLHPHADSSRGWLVGADGTAFYHAEEHG